MLQCNSLGETSESFASHSTNPSEDYAETLQLIV